MSRRVVTVRTVKGYLSQSLVSLERALSASARCVSVKPGEHLELVKVYRELSRINQKLGTKSQ